MPYILIDKGIHSEFIAFNMAMENNQFISFISKQPARQANYILDWYWAKFRRYLSSIEKSTREFKSFNRLNANRLTFLFFFFFFWCVFAHNFFSGWCFVFEVSWKMNWIQRIACCKNKMPSAWIGHAAKMWILYKYLCFAQHVIVCGLCVRVNNIQKHTHTHTTDDVNNSIKFQFEFWSVCGVLDYE